MRGRAAARMCKVHLERDLAVGLRDLREDVQHRLDEGEEADATRHGSEKMRLRSEKRRHASEKRKQARRQRRNNKNGGRID